MQSTPASRSSPASSSAIHDWLTVSRLRVRVPVLSVAMPVLPSVSTAGGCRTIALRPAIRWSDCERDRDHGGQPLGNRRHGEADRRDHRIAGGKAANRRRDGEQHGRDADRDRNHPAEVVELQRQQGA